MLEIPLYILLIIYAALALIFILSVLANLYHLFAFGFLSFFSFLVAFVFLAGVFVILFITYKWAMGIDWAQVIII